MSLQERHSIDEKVHRGFALTRDQRPDKQSKFIRWLTAINPFRGTKSNEYAPLYQGRSHQSVQNAADDLREDVGYGRAIRGITPRSFAVLVSLYFIANSFYLLSLRGAASPKELNGMLGFLGVSLVTSVCFLSAQLWASLVLLSLTPRWKRLNGVILISTLGLWYLLDSGNRLSSHGAFNLLIFCIIFIPSNVCVGFLYFWYCWASSTKEKRPRRFFGQFLGVTVVAAILLLLVATNKEHALSYGFLGKQISCSVKDRNTGTCHACQWKSAVPWFDLLPLRLNIFTGPMTCPVEDIIQASFTSDGILSIECDSPVTEAKSWLNGTVIMRHDGAIYTTLPRTERWGLHWKGDSLNTKRSPLQQQVLSIAERNLRRYEAPVTIDDDTDTILALCGSKPPKILNRITPAPAAEPTIDEASPVGLSVVTLFVDAVSRRQVHRRLPETGQMLERIVTAPHSMVELFEFFRYHTVGLNTGPNTRALWAGLDEQEPNAPGVPLWEQYESSGYVSGRIDPMCQDWSAYYNAAHFPNSNGTYIDRPRLSHEYLTWSCFPPYLPLGGHNSGNFAGPTSIKARCLSGTYVGWHELDWATKFIKTYENHKSKPFYLNAAFMEGHEGSSEVLRTLDVRLEQFLNPKTSPIDFNSTAVLLLSDHGALMGLNNAFFQNGKTEAANPAAIMLLPRWLTSATRRGENLREATQRLVTAHDLYETMKEFITINPNSISYEDVNSWPLPSENQRGFNLFRQLVPDRTCDEAGIAEFACKCV